MWRLRGAMYMRLFEKSVIETFENAQLIFYKYFVITLNK